MKALVAVVSELARMDEPRKHVGGLIHGLEFTTTSAMGIRCSDAACPTWIS